MLQIVHMWTQASLNCNNCFQILEEKKIEIIFFRLFGTIYFISKGNGQEQYLNNFMVKHSLVKKTVPFSMHSFVQKLWALSY